MSGYIVVRGVQFPVTGIRLAQGKVILACTVPGPVAAYDAVTPVTVFGEDGLGVCQGDCLLQWLEVGPGDTLQVQVLLAMNRCYGDAEELEASR